MLLLAIDLYGIQPFEQPKRIVLRPGFNILTGPNGTGKTMICQIISSLFLEGRTKGISLFDNQPNQAAITFQASDKTVYRLSTDYQKGTWKLAKRDPGTKKFIPAEDNKQNIIKWFHQEANGLGGKEIITLLMIDRFRLPSLTLHQNGHNGYNQNTVVADPISDPELATDIPYPEPTRSEKPPLSSKEWAEKEKALKEAQEDMEKMAEWDEQMLNRQDKIAALNDRIRKLHDLDLQLNNLQEAETKRFSLIIANGMLPVDLFRHYEEALLPKHNTLADLEEEQAEIDIEIAKIKKVDPLKDPSFLSGVGLIMLSFLLPFAVVLKGPLRYLFLVGVVGGVGLTGFSYHKIARRVATKEALRKKGTVLKTKTLQIEKEFEQDHKEVIDFMKKTGTKDIPAIKELQYAYQKHIQNKQETQDKTQALLKGETLETMNQEIEALEEAVSILQEKLRGYEEVSQEVYRLREELRSATYGVETQQQESPPPGLNGSHTETYNFSALSTLAAITSIGEQRSRPLSIEQIERDANILFSLFRYGKKHKIHLDQSGQVKLGEVDLHRVSSGLADQVFLSLSLSALNQFPDLPFPLLLDDPFITLDPSNQEVAIELLRGVAKNRQVILCTAARLTTKEDDNYITLV